jgi:methionine-rich copper-binding protein CopC
MAVAARFRRAWVATALLLLGAVGAEAHALLRHASPAAGAELKAPPTEITLDFSERPEPAFSQVEVRDPKGVRIDKGDLHAAPGVPTRLVESLAPAGPGTFSVAWHVVSVDTHRTDGHFTYTVAP